MNMLRAVSLLVIAFCRATNVSASNMRKLLGIIVFIETFVAAARQDVSSFQTL